MNLVFHDNEATSGDETVVLETAENVFDYFRAQHILYMEKALIEIGNRI